MILRFGVSNHLSIRDPLELSFVASSLKDESAGLIDCAAIPNGSLLPAVVIYGPNASGKSNLIDAIRTMRTMVLWSHTKGEPGGGVPRSPFRLDPACSQMPSHFDIDFVVDGLRYHYGFEASATAFDAEWLYTFPKSQRRLLFEREGDTFNFGRGLRGQNSNIADLTRLNSLYLSAAAQNSHEQLSKVFGFFRSVLGVRGVAVHSEMASEQLSKQGIDYRVLTFLNEINAGVLNYRRKETALPENLRAARQEMFAALKKAAGSRFDIEMNFDDRHYTIELAHQGRDGEPVYFELDRESAGTRRLLIVLGRAYKALDEGRPLCVDELDASLHTHASEALLKLFCSPESNPKGAQLIATTHDTNLLETSVLRRDQVWFAEKDAEGATRLFPLTEFRTRKGDNFERGYLQGRYGAVPFNVFPRNS